MAVLAKGGDFAVSDPPKISLSPATKQILLYVLIATVAIAVSVPAAIATADIGLFEECFASADICAAP